MCIYIVAVALLFSKVVCLQSSCTSSLLSVVYRRAYQGLRNYHVDRKTSSLCCPGHPVRSTTGGDKRIKNHGWKGKRAAACCLWLSTSFGPRACTSGCAMSPAGMLGAAWRGVHAADGGWNRVVRIQHLGFGDVSTLDSCSCGVGEHLAIHDSTRVHGASHPYVTK